MSHHRSRDRLSRRAFLGASAAAASLVTGCVPVVSGHESAGKTVNAAGSPRALRFALMTDVHMFDKKNAPRGFAKALTHCQGLDDPPTLIVTGGDNIMDAYETPLAQAQGQFDLVKTIYRDHCDLPVRWCIGNHDVWGFDKEKTGADGSETLWGKGKPVDEFEMPGRYYAFDTGGWRMLILDSTQFNAERPPGYLGRIDAEQFAWLTRTLEATPAERPLLVVSHIPILTVTVFEDAPTDDFACKIPGGWMHYDSKAVRHLLERHPNVRLCLSGHTHRIDRVDWRGITYVCCGAVSGSWWNGDRGHTEEGYMLVDLYEDGSFETRYVAYNWTV